MLTAEDYYDIIAANERILEESRRMKQRVAESPRHVQLQEQYLQHAINLGILPAKVCQSPLRSRKPVSPAAQRPRGPSRPAQRPVPPPELGSGHPSRNRIARELARAESSFSGNSAAAALAVTQALYGSPDSSRSRSPYGSRGISKRHLGSDSKRDSNSSHSSGSSSCSSSGSTLNRAIERLSHRDDDEWSAASSASQDLSDRSSASSSCSSRGLQRGEVRIARQVVLLEEGSAGGGASRGISPERAVDRARGWLSGGHGGRPKSGRSSSVGRSPRLLLPEPTPAFMQRWRAARKRRTAKKQAVRFLLRSSDDGELSPAEDLQAASVPVELPGLGGLTESLTSAAAGDSTPGTSGRSSPSPSSSSPGVFIVYPGSSLIFPAQPLPYSFEEALEAVRQQQDRQPPYPQHLHQQPHEHQHQHQHSQYGGLQSQQQHQRQRWGPYDLQQHTQHASLFTDDPMTPTCVVTKAPLHPAELPAGVRPPVASRVATPQLLPLRPDGEEISGPGDQPLLPERLLDLETAWRDWDGAARPFMSPPRHQLRPPVAPAASSAPSGGRTPVVGLQFSGQGALAAAIAATGTGAMAVAGPVDASPVAEWGLREGPSQALWAAETKSPYGSNINNHDSYISPGRVHEMVKAALGGGVTPLASPRPRDAPAAWTDRASDGTSSFESLLVAQPDAPPRSPVTPPLSRPLPVPLTSSPQATSTDATARARAQPQMITHEASSPAGGSLSAAMPQSYERPSTQPQLPPLAVDVSCSSVTHGSDALPSPSTPPAPPTAAQLEAAAAFPDDPIGSHDGRSSISGGEISGGPSFGMWAGTGAGARSGPSHGSAAESGTAGSEGSAPLSLRSLKDQQSAITRDVQALMQRLADMKGKLDK